MENRILPDHDIQVSALASDIIEALSAKLAGEAQVHESTETGEPIIDIPGCGELGGNRRFRVCFTEIS